MSTIERLRLVAPPMTVHIASGLGSAQTELAAFDAALVQVGAANFNLIRLSSVIPPGTTIVDSGRCPTPAGARWGDRLYVVYAEQRASTPGTEAWAGVGWVQDTDSGHGLFVEHEGHDEVKLRSELTSSLEELQASRGLDLGPIHTRVIGTVCRDEPVCALVLCAFGAEGWHGDGRPVASVGWS